ncbi:uncharacterized protein P174DRAFT_426209 [Aspergillus novofumigatus IBT 16806]|uniref:Uncharacterized protein n=1 Tax=Aspergillus novofumigatus (strain IBT 16806) TaxID=1392255 RepID=A0A2I1BS34_ASPN1|nr:uncharacterized protein P174DRAFT_426209 [Aspergillus novofumigatus IBT 16806]PKX88172.1 hypothetical protein P174DRAFT_426209 [Aspergillus novofumigatus IBT 16806]
MAVWHTQQAQAQQWAAMDIQQQQHRTQQGLDEEMAQAKCMQWQDQSRVIHAVCPNPYAMGGSQATHAITCGFLIPMVAMIVIQANGKGQIRAAYGSGWLQEKWG